MKIEKVSNNKVKLTITYEDMEKWGVSIENLIVDSPQARVFFRTLIKKAEAETGFCVDNARLMIEALPYKYDGIIVFVTNLDAPFFEKKPRVRAKAISHRQTKHHIFCFESFDDICDFVKNCDNTSFDVSIYTDNNKYYLITSGDINPLIFEYAKKIPGSCAVLSHLFEYGKCIIENEAIETIEKYFG